MRFTRIIVTLTLVFTMFSFVPSPRGTDALVGWVGAAGSPYIGSALTQPFDINLSRNSGDSMYHSFKLDSSGNPCIAWSDNSQGNNDIYYARWNGSSWVNISGITLTSTNGNVSNNSGTSYDPSFVFDSSGFPNITWSDDTPGNYEIYYAKWNGSNWITVTGANLNATNGNLSNNSGYSAAPRIDLDSSNNPHITWYDQTLPWGVYYTTWNGSNWVSYTGATLNATNGNITGMAAWSPTIVIDSSDKPCLAWDCSNGALPGDYEIYYARLEGTNWVNASGSTAGVNFVNAIVSNSSGLSKNVSLVLDSSDNPCLTWYDQTPGAAEVYYAKWNGTGWVNASGNIYNSANGRVTFNGGSSLTYTYRESLQLDSKGNPHIVYHTNVTGNYEIHYIKWSGTNWVNISGTPISSSNGNVSGNIGISRSGSLVLDASDNPNIVWVDSTPGNYDVYFVHFANAFDGLIALNKSIDTNGDSNFNDNGAIVNAGDTLTYKISWQFNQGQDPLENPYLYDTVPEGTTYVAGSASPINSLSYSTDNGVTWTAGEPPNGSPGGTMLRWNIISGNVWVGANDSLYMPDANPQPDDINVSRNAGTSNPTSFLLDSSNNPCISWSDNTPGNYDIYFAKWNGSNWVNISGAILTTTNGSVINNSGDSLEPSLSLDSSGNPCIAWRDNMAGNYDIYYARWNGTNWINASGAILTATNGIVITNTGVSSSPSLSLNTSNYPCIAWFDNTPGNNEIFYTRWSGTNWTNATGTNLSATNGRVSNNTGASEYPELKLNASGMPNIVWRDMTPGNYDVFFTKWSGSNWVNAAGTNLNATNGNVSNNSGNSLDPTLVINMSNMPCIMWSDITTGSWGICYAVWNGTNWLNMAGATITATNSYTINITGTTQGISFALNGLGYPEVTWAMTYSAVWEMFYAKWNGSAWINTDSTILLPDASNARVSKSVAWSTFPLLALDNRGFPHIVWREFILTSPAEVYYIKLTPMFDSDFTFSIKVDNPPTTLAFCNKATLRHKWDNGAAIESNDVCNTIDYNFIGTFTLDKSVDTNSDGIYTDSGAIVDPGSKISYKIDWFFDNPNKDPLFGAYLYDTIPAGTKYSAGSSPVFNMSYSIDGGSTWIVGEPPNGSPSGTRLRWKINQPGWTNVKGQLVNSTNPNISNTAGVSDFPSLAINNNGDPCIAWSDDVSGVTLVYYARWNGSQWVNVAGLPFTIANGSTGGISGGDPSLALDPVTGNPWIAFQSNAILFSNLEIHILRWNGNQWTNAAGATATLLNTNVSNNTGLSWFPSHQLALDSNGYPCFVWKDNTTGSWQSYFVRWNGANWTNVSGAVLSATNGSIGNGIVDPSFWPTLVLDENDYPCIAWDSTIAGNSEVCFARWNGSQWVNSYGTPLTTTNCNISNNSGSSVVPYLAMDKLTHNPCIVWSDDTPGNYEIYFAKWNGSSWVNANGNNLNTTNANISFTSGSSSLLSIAIDGNNHPAVTWEDDISGNSEIYFSKWNGSSWVNSQGDLFTTANGVINTSSARSWFPSLAYDPLTNNPNIAWLDRTPGNNEVYFAKWNDYKQTFTFSVTIDKPFSNLTLSPICNTASFSHAFDKGNPQVSNNVCVKIKTAPIVKSANLVVKKTSKSFQYTPKDTITFYIIVTNTGDLAAENVVLTDNFPRELEFVSSSPSGSTGNSVVRFKIGDLTPKASAVFTLKFKLSSEVDVRDCITVINEAVVTSGKIVTKDNSVINICTPKAPCDLYIDTIWSGLDKKGVRSKGVPVKLSVIPRCGASPYTVKIYWGDGSPADKGYIQKEGDSLGIEHDFPENGDFSVRITCEDAYGSTKIITRTIK